MQVRGKLTAKDGNVYLLEGVLKPQIYNNNTSNTTKTFVEKVCNINDEDVVHHDSYLNRAKNQDGCAGFVMQNCEGCIVEESKMGKIVKKEQEEFAKTHSMGCDDLYDSVICDQKVWIANDMSRKNQKQYHDRNSMSCDDLYDSAGSEEKIDQMDGLYRGNKFSFVIVILVI